MDVLGISRAVPPRLQAGDSLEWSVQSGLPLGSSLLIVMTLVGSAPIFSVRLGGGGGTAVDAEGVATFSATSDTSKTWLPGRYVWLAAGFDADGKRTTLATGATIVDPDLAGDTPIDPRSYNEKMLAQIRALLQGKMLDDVAMYKIGTRELTKIPLDELRRAEADYEARVKREYRRKAGKPAQTARITFGGL